MVIDATRQTPDQVGSGETGRSSGPLPGLLLAILVAIPATVLGQFFPVIGGPIFGLALGAGCAILVRRIAGPKVVEHCAAGFAFASKQVLKVSIVLLGTGLSLTQVLQVGTDSLPVMLGTLAVALVVAALLGRLLRVDSGSGTLIGVGTGICGASAIAAASSVLPVRQVQIAYAMATIFLFNVVAVVVFPPLGHLFGLSETAFGVWSGTAINDTSSVVAAAYTYGAEAGDHAVIVKLTRSLMIIPICLALVVWQRKSAARAAGEPAGTSWWRIVPLFILGFLAASAARTLGLIPDSFVDPLSWAATFCITVALTAIGFSLRASAIRQAGPRPLLLGLFVWLAVAVSSLGLQAAFGQL
ncbi:putative integral membrane protein (TIGR00698 family) [Tamaricihabitans halophyticus]|uniref:Putative integral membrane protein (TIGR00698 family) n=1 Tax=Tamaricihabitans halophyticus TaxID=1262583 RepID=A0A4R2Q856_9PSEU|nr:putative sulfate exporter family transporter [Tamaricihabitans halophyticus]TCP44729.1 putative integral membrane protein (TIGR00698 family) [Tamaricihabitans halophyticus]